MRLTQSRFDQIGTIARRVNDLVLWDSVMTGSYLHTRSELGSIRIGVAAAQYFSSLDTEVDRICAEALYLLNSTGAHLAWVEAPEEISLAMDAAQTIVLYETVAAIDSYLEDNNAGLDLEQILETAGATTRFLFKEAVLPPNNITGDVYRAALNKREKVSGAVVEFFKQNEVDVLAFPAVLTANFQYTIENSISMGGHERVVPYNVAMCRNTALACCGGMPSLVIPVGRTAAGVPVGMEFVAPRDSDMALLSLGLELERVFPSLPAPALG
jgi:mandelamide amidase